MVPIDSRNWQAASAVTEWEKQARRKNRQFELIGWWKIVVSVIGQTVSKLLFD